MNAERQAIKDIKYLASMMRGLTEFSDQLGEAATLETLLQAKQSRIAELEREESTIAQRVDACAADCTEKIRAAETKASQTIASADALRDEAGRLKGEAERLVSDARQEATGILAAAKTDARQAVALEIEAIKRKL